tara:strand:- start:8141 stop:8419 length:279 start_codon:yes stop_codon:yes gene_type:complete
VDFLNDLGGLFSGLNEAVNDVNGIFAGLSGGGGAVGSTGAGGGIAPNLFGGTGIGGTVNFGAGSTAASSGISLPIVIASGIAAVIVILLIKR